MLPSASQKQKVPLWRQRMVSKRCIERSRPLINFLVKDETSFFLAFTVTVVILSDLFEFFFVVKLNGFDVTFGNHFRGHDAVVDEQEVVNDGAVKMKQILDACSVASADDTVVHMMTAVLHAFCHALDGQVGALQPEIDEAGFVAFLTCLVDEGVVGFGGQGGLDGKVFFVSDEFLDAREHQAACGDLGAVGVERRQTLGDLVAVDELLALQRLWQNSQGSGRLTCSIAT